MPVQVYCPHCGLVYSANPAPSGQAIRCQSCQGLFTPESSAAKPAKKTGTPPAEKPSKPAAEPVAAKPADQPSQKPPAPTKPPVPPAQKPVQAAASTAGVKPASAKASAIQPATAVAVPATAVKTPTAKTSAAALAPPKKKSPLLMILLLVFGILFVVALLCAGGIGLVSLGGYVLVSRSVQVAQDGDHDFPTGTWKIETRKDPKIETKKDPKIETKKDPGKPDPPPKKIASIDDALEELRASEANKRQEALLWLAKAHFEANRQPEVAKALNPLLASRDQNTKTAALRALKVWATRDNVPALIAVLEEVKPGPPVGEPQQLAMDLLGQLKDERGVEPVARFLPSVFTHDRAFKALQEMGPVADKEMLKLYHHPEPGLRDPAKRLLEGYGVKPSAILKQSLEDLKSTNTARRRLAAEWFAGQKPDAELRPEVAAALGPLLTEADVGLVLAALRALKEWATRENTAALIDIVENTKTGEYRRLAIEVLVQHKQKQAVPAIARRLIHFNERGLVAKALPAFGQTAITELKDNYVEHPDRGVRDEAVRILKSMNATDNPELMAVLLDLKSNDPQRAQAGFDKLAKLKVDPLHKQQTAGVLEPLLEEKDRTGVADRAAKALGVWGSKENVPALVKAVEHMSRAVRHAAMEALAKLKDERGVAPIVARLVVPGDRGTASKSLIDMGVIVEPEVIKGLEKDDKAVKIECCKILEAVGTKKSIGALNQAVQAGNKAKQKDVVEAAQEAIQAINGRS